METAKPSLELLRSLTDEHVLRELMLHKRLTRAELAAETGISKPTVGESVRRLAEIGLVQDTGERTPGGRGRGRVGSYYALAPDVGTALAISIGPEGVTAQYVDAYGDVLSRTRHEIGRPARPEEIAAALRTAARPRPGTGTGTAVKPRLAVVSAADPVDRRTGRLVHLPQSPFLLGELDAVETLSPYVDGPVTVDNDVNWAARAERDHTPSGALDHFAYVFLGEGLGCAIVSDGEVRRGSAGLAGEIAHILTPGPHGGAVPLIEVFGELGLRQADSTAIDVERLTDAVTGPGPQAAAVRAALGQAINAVIAALIALTDPETVVIGGPWGTHPAILEAVAAAAALLPRRVPTRAAELTLEPALTGARTDAVDRLRAAILATAARATGQHLPLGTRSIN